MVTVDVLLVAGLVVEGAGGDGGDVHLKDCLTFIKSNLSLTSASIMTD